LGIDVKGTLRVAIAAVAITLVQSTYATASHHGVSVEIDWQPVPNDREGALWLAYLSSRAAYINQHEGAYDWKPGVVTPSFAEELAARTSVVQVYREQRQKDSQLSLAYFEDLARIADHSFLGEYVWTYLHQGEWGPPSDKLHLVDFMHWRAENLAQHVVLTRGELRFGANGEAPPADATRASASETPVVREGRKLLEAGKNELAVAGYFDPVIEHYERTYRDSDKHVYAARNQMQSILYLALPHDDKKDVEVLDSTWSDAYLLKAYALTELRRLGDAQTALERAVALSPFTADYVSELAYTYQVQGQCDRSISSYREAESIAQIGSDDSTKTSDLTRAWRGQGYCLVENGQLDEAEKLYRKCLELDPSDTKAKGEIEYIKRKRTH
jgi:tetratricopeptide (TPR) repeat protein